MKHSIIITLFAVAALPAAAKFSVDKIDPPHWWAGMKESTLQLQVQGQDVRSAVPEVSYPGISIDSVARLDGSSNWQYIYLRLAPDVKPGKFDITWRQGKQKVTRQYRLLPRRTKPGAQGFTQADVLYMVMPDRFADGNPDNNRIAAMNHPIGADRSNPNKRHGGDLKGIADHLDYIDSLGVTTLWLNPVLENDMADGSYHGYAVTDYYAIDRRFGSNDEYSALNDSLHNRGMKVVMDMIFNHCGSGHPWFLDPPASDWFNHQKEGFTPTTHQLASITDPYAAAYDRDLAENGWFVANMPDLNQLNPHLLKYLIQNSIFWVEEAGIDGIRMDTYPYADPGAMKEWVEAVYDEYPDFTIVGECWFADPALVSRWQKGSPLATPETDTGLPVVMDFPLMIKSRNLKPYTERTDGWNGLAEIYKHLGLDFVYADPSKLLRFLDNHDTERVILETPADLGSWKQAVTLLLTVPGIPQIYYGTELLMAGDRQGGDGNVRRDVPGGFPGDTVNAFTREGRTDLQNEAYDFMSQLLQWRKTSQPVISGSMKHFAPTDGIYLYERYAYPEKVIVVMNGRDEENTASLSRFAEVLTPGRYRNQLTGKLVTLDPDEEYTFAPREIMILTPVKPVRR